MIDVLALLQKYQSIVSAAIGLTTAVLVAPKIGERYARSREYWTRRLDHAQAMADFGLQLRVLPEAPADLFHKNNPKFDSAIEQAVRLTNQGRLLYAGDLHSSLFHLLQYSILLPSRERLAFWNALSRFLEAETRGDARHAQLGMLADVIKLTPLIFDRAEAGEALGSADSFKTSAHVETCHLAVIQSFRRTMRRWAIARPWRWPAGARWEWRIRRESKRLRAQAT